MKFYNIQYNTTSIAVETPQRHSASLYHDRDNRSESSCSWAELEGGGIVE